jgi:hypothetical protein
MGRWEKSRGDSVGSDWRYGGLGHVGQRVRIHRRGSARSGGNHVEHGSSSEI